LKYLASRATNYAFPRWSAVAALAAGVIGLSVVVIELAVGTLYFDDIGLLRNSVLSFVAPLLAVALVGVYRGLHGHQHRLGIAGCSLALMTIEAEAIVLSYYVMVTGDKFMWTLAETSYKWVVAADSVSWVTLTGAWLLLGLAHLRARRLQGSWRVAPLVAALPLAVPYVLNLFAAEVRLLLICLLLCVIFFPSALPLLTPYLDKWFPGPSIPDGHGLVLGVTSIAFGIFLGTARVSEDR
jgi:hypothetical protein